MTAEQSILDGGCSCGAIRFHAGGAPLWVVHCHCTDCRKATAAAFSTYAAYAADDVRWSGAAPGIHASSPGVERAFCGACGTPLYYASRRWPGQLHLLAGAFDAPEALRPQVHVYVKDRLPWVRLADGLAEHWETPSQA